MYKARKNRAILADCEKEIEVYRNRLARDLELAEEREDARIAPHFRVPWGIQVLFERAGHAVPLTYDALVGRLRDVFRTVADSTAVAGQKMEVVAAQREEIATLCSYLEESRATVARLSQVTIEIAVLRDEQNA